MIQNHPYQCMYFNFMAGSPASIEKNFVLDYWGISFPEVLRKVGEIDSRDSICINVSSYPGRTNIVMMPPALQMRLHYTDTNYTNGISQGDYALGYMESDLVPQYPEVYNVKAYGMKINRIMKVPESAHVKAAVE